MKRFLVTGFPRTRTAWLSALFSSEEVVCTHDAIVSCGGLKEWASECITGKINGLFDPAACCFPPLVEALFSRAPIVFIERDAEDSATAARGAGLPVDAWWLSMQAGQLKEVLRGALKLVKVEALESYDEVAALYNYCTGLELSRQRFDQFNLLKIEQHHGKAMRRVPA